MAYEKEVMNKPVKKFFVGSVSVAVWPNKTALRDGKQIETLSVTLERSFKDSAGEWRNASSLRDNDIPKAMLALAKAYDYLTAKGEATAEEA